MQGEMLELKSTEFEVDEEGIATIWLSRPKRMNAWTGRMHTEYRYLLSRAEQDQGIRGIVVTGRGKACVLEQGRSAGPRLSARASAHGKQ